MGNNNKQSIVNFDKTIDTFGWNMPREKHSYSVKDKGKDRSPLNEAINISTVGISFVGTCAALKVPREPEIATPGKVETSWTLACPNYHFYSEVSVSHLREILE